MQASDTDQRNSSESLHARNVNSPLEDCHIFYFKVSVSLMSPSNSLCYCVVWHAQMKIMGSGIGMSDFKPWLCRC